MEINDFMYKIEDQANDGINLFKISQFDNLDMRVNILMGLLDGSVSNTKNNNELIEPHVEEILKNIKSEDIYRYK